MPDTTELNRYWGHIQKKLVPVLEAGYGKVIIQVQAGQIVYITQEIGEQVKMDLDGHKQN